MSRRDQQTARTVVRRARGQQGERAAHRLADCGGRTERPEDELSGDHAGAKEGTGRNPPGAREGIEPRVFVRGCYFREEPFSRWPFPPCLRMRFSICANVVSFSADSPSSRTRFISPEIAGSVTASQSPSVAR